MAGERRRCNFLEGIFVQENIRFVVGLSFVEKRDVHKVQAVFEDSFTAHGAHHRMECTGDDEQPEIVRDDATSKSTISAQIIESVLKGQTLRDIVQSNVCRDTPSSGPVTLTLYTDTSEPSVVVYAVLNLNHSLMDAIAVKTVIKSINARLQSDALDDYSKVDSSCDWFRMDDWEALVAGSMPKLIVGEPEYLPLSSAPLTISDVLVRSDASDDAAASDVVVTFDPDVVARCLDAARRCSTTLTGLWIACLFRALATMYFENLGNRLNSCSLAVSVLVDLRPKFAHQKILQVQAFVTIGRLVEARELQESNMQSWLWKVAQESIQDARQRIERGEGHRQALALATGQIDRACPDGTVELSNHGIYDAPAQVEVSQRYDDYQGLSVIVHTCNGGMKGTASGGTNISAAAVAAFMSRVHNLLRLAASSSR